jgi:hypothetical protein
MGTFDTPEFGRGGAGFGVEGPGSRRRTTRSRTSRATTARHVGGPSSVHAHGLYPGQRWRDGGEAEVAAAIGTRAAGRVIALHERAVPNSRLMLDHVVVTSSAVWVIASARCTGRIEVDHRVLSRERLTVGGVDRTELIDDLAKQVEAVESVLAALAPAVPVSGALCVVTPKGVMSDTGLPLIRPLVIGGFPLLTPQRLAGLLSADGGIAPVERTRLARALAQRFPPRRDR